MSARGPALAVPSDESESLRRGAPGEPLAAGGAAGVRLPAPPPGTRRVCLAIFQGSVLDSWARDRVIESVPFVFDAGDAARAPALYANVAVGDRPGVGSATMAEVARWWSCRQQRLREEAWHRRFAGRAAAAEDTQTASPAADAGIGDPRVSQISDLRDGAPARVGSAPARADAGRMRMRPPLGIVYPRPTLFRFATDRRDVECQVVARWGLGDDWSGYEVRTDVVLAAAPVPYTR